ncbi:MAG: glycine cleavage system aminomethyltransferase GcvT [Bacteroidales bacterium]|nr:glycine cleavage system aminomethyltransferase GcvT [Bacteroidales bacterium]MDD7277493.1 glycine cleavage system aminomethyltransferase GcvT [Bacteroidales bacterium]MDY6075841.1 glycine cleavage system aminomethyltransferase GcvT [Bacteroidales bacterium]
MMENTDNLKKTALNAMHYEMGAKMVPFAGFDMPVQFEGVNIEHETVRKGVGVFDVSHMGEFRAKGPKAFDLVQRCTSNDIASLYDGKVLYTTLPNGKGGIVDDMLVYRVSAEEYFMVPNAANIDKDWAWMSEVAKEMGMELGKEFMNESNSWSQLAVQGPLALKAMQKLTSASVEDMEYYTFKIIEFAGVKDIIFSTTGYTGSGGCEIYIPNAEAVNVYKQVLEAGKEFGIKPIGLGARDTLRLEMGFCLYGNDICDTTSPMEAGLGWITKFVDGNNFIDREYNEKQKAEGVTRKLVAFEITGKGIARHEYEICDAEGNHIGEVTSGTMGPSVKKAIGMGYVKKEFSKVGSEIFIKIREKLIPAVVVRLPFYKGEN